MNIIELIHDIEVVQEALQNGCSLVVVRSGRIVAKDSDGGLKPVVRLIKYGAGLLEDAIVGDKVIGLAAARAYRLVRVRGIYCRTISVLAMREIQRLCFPVWWEKSVPFIMDRNGQQLCPFERIAQQLEKPNELIKYLEAIFCSQDREE